MRFFLNSFYYSIFISLLLLAWFFGLYWIFLAILIAFLILLFFSRRIAPAFQEDATLKEGIFFSPVNGKVFQINENQSHHRFGENLTEIVVVSSWWSEHGIYFPFKSEVIDLIYEGHKGHFRYLPKGIFGPNNERKPSLSLGLRSVDSVSVGLDFYKCILGFWPQVRVIPGDKGRAQVNMGFFGLGGTIVLYLPSSYEILIKEGLDLIAGQSIVARLKEVKKVEA
jgi:hypothetical protein